MKHAKDKKKDSKRLHTRVHHRKDGPSKFGLIGSSTVEAALIMPLILAVIFMLLFLTLFLYTRTSFVRNGYLAVLRGSQAESKTKNVRVGIAKKEFSNLASSGYNGDVAYEADYSSKGEAITIRIKLAQRLPRVIFSNEHLQNIVSSELAFRATTCHPVDFIRTCRRIQRAKDTLTQ